MCKVVRFTTPSWLPSKGTQEVIEKGSPYYNILTDEKGKLRSEYIICKDVARNQIVFYDEKCYKLELMPNGDILQTKT